MAQILLALVIKDRRRVPVVLVVFDLEVKNRSMWFHLRSGMTLDVSLPLELSRVEFQVLFNFRFMKSEFNETVVQR